MVQPHSHRPRSSQLLEEVLASHDADRIALGALAESFGRRAFGILLLLVTLPSFIPLPIGGGAMGPLVSLCGLQMLLGLRQPWLPRFVARREIGKDTLFRLMHRIGPLLQRLERWCKPRGALAAGPAGRWLSGLALVVLGIGLALPIPLTNYPFGVLLLIFALALIEGDGYLLVGCWIVAALVLVAMLLTATWVWSLLA